LHSQTFVKERHHSSW